MTESIEQFLEELGKSLSTGSFVKLTVGNYRGAGEHPQKVTARLVDTKRGRQVSFQKHYETRQTVTNVEIGGGVAFVGDLLRSGFRSAHLFTIARDFQLKIGKRSSHLKAGKATFDRPVPTAHDREKHRLIDQSGFFLKALGIIGDNGRVRSSQQDKWRQINKYVEILRDLFERSSLRDRSKLRIVDMGSGKGYLTFAAYDYFANVLGLKIEMTGVDTRRDMVDLCSQISEAAGFDGLKFVTGSIEDFDPGEVDILIALHACDTATDEALYKGVSSGAEMIVAAPCCHKEIRRQIKPPDVLANILKHGTMLEREAETITDGLRAMLLERSGYVTKIFEFVPVEHTPKNNMIAAVRKGHRSTDRGDLNRKIADVKSMYGIEEHRLESLLA